MINAGNNTIMIASKDSEPTDYKWFVECYMRPKIFPYNLFPENTYPAQTFEKVLEIAYNALNREISGIKMIKIISYDFGFKKEFDKYSDIEKYAKLLAFL